MGQKFTIKRYKLNKPEPEEIVFDLGDLSIADIQIHHPEEWKKIEQIAFDYADFKISPEEAKRQIDAILDKLKQEYEKKQKIKLYKIIGATIGFITLIVILNFVHC